jgi:hypothetical protein
LQPEREFRCFAAGHALVAISQRDPSQHFPQLGLPREVQAVLERVTAWHARHISSSFPLDSCKWMVLIAAYCSAVSATC